MSDTTTQTRTRTTTFTEAATAFGFPASWFFLFTVGIMLVVLTSFIQVLSKTGTMLVDGNAITWLDFLGTTGVGAGLLGAGITSNNGHTAVRIVFVVLGLAILMGGLGIF